MKYNTEKKLIELCKLQIIRRAGFDENKVLTHKDYEYLCYIIEEKSKINLSVSTLKRIWKNEYDRLPQDSTLDTLARFIDYGSWNAFRKAALKVTHSKNRSPKDRSFPKITGRKSLLLSVLILSLSILLVFIIIHFKNHNRSKTISAENVIFKSYGTVSTGVPNTVVFEYNIDDVDADSFFIQQSWDTHRRERIYKGNHYHTEIYYYPDFHVAKLIANNKVIKEHDVYVNTDGWLPYVTYYYFNEKPIYLEVDSITKNNALSVSYRDLQKNNIDFDKNWVVHFRNTGAFKRIDSDNFTLKTKVRIKNEVFRSCPFFFLMVNCRDASFDFPLVKKGCENTVWIKFSDFVVSGKESDLSFTGCNLEDWQEIVLKNADKHVTVFLNDRKIFQHSYTRPGNAVAGFDFFSNCISEMDYVLLYDKDNQLIYEDRFENAGK